MKTLKQWCGKCKKEVEVKPTLWISDSRLEGYDPYIEVTISGYCPECGREVISARGHLAL